MELRFIQSHRRFTALSLFFVSALCLLPSFAFSQTTASEPEKLEALRRHLHASAIEIQNLQDAIKELKNQSDSEESQLLAKELENQKNRMEEDFDSLATGLAGDGGSQKRQRPDWIKELEDLTLPLLRSVRELTEKPRKIDNLKHEIKVLEEQLPLYERVHERITMLIELEKQFPSEPESSSDEYLKELQSLLQEFNPELIEINLEKNKANLEYILSSGGSLFENVSSQVEHFFKNRGRNLFVTAASFIGIWWLLSRLRRWATTTRLLKELSPSFHKIFAAAYNMFALGICFAAALACLFFFNDWLLISILVILLFLAFWTSRQWIPKFLNEIKFILNLGTVREGERMIWQGIPWRVRDIGLYATLVNDRLQGGVIKLQVGELIGRHSREIVEGEPWFPTLAGDWVVLSDGAYGQVESQTLEQVVLKLKGASLKYYSTSHFLTTNPINLSSGFRYCIDFRMDVKTLSEAVLETPALIKKELTAKLAKHFEGSLPDFLDIDVQYDHADAHSLHLAILIAVDGRCAGFREEYQREIQSALAQICVENQIVIPFERLSVNLMEASVQRPPES